MKDLVRISTCVPLVNVADVNFNYEQIREKASNILTDDEPHIIAFPELSLTGCSCEDLFFQENLIERAREKVINLVCDSEIKNTILVVGTPLMLFGQLYNCAVVMFNKEILGIIPKTYLKNFTEKKWFSSATDIKETFIKSSDFGIRNRSDYKIPIGNNLVFKVNNVKFGVEIGEDLTAPIPPSTHLAMNGAEIIINIAATPQIVGSKQYREDLVKAQSEKNICNYVFVSAGATESTTNTVYSGNTFFAENGKIIEKNENVIDTNYHLTVDFDVAKVRADRIKEKTFKDTAATYNSFYPCTNISAFVDKDVNEKFLKERKPDFLEIKKLPFIPSTKAEREARCWEIFMIQVASLKKRIFMTGSKLVLGVSGGLDSTLALLVAVQTMKSLGRDLKDVIGITMPGFGTSDKTYKNSLKFMELLGITSIEIPIRDACIQHFKDIDHDINDHSVTYENSQARERTQILMDYANKVGGLVVGTGDLSELALGWCTYNGDHMSMYGVNAGVPKTLVRWMVETIKEYPSFADCKEVLTDILDTPISPELLPPDANGKIAQKTEDNIGPYALHDFFLYYTVRYGFSPIKVFTYAREAFVRDFDKLTILKWLKVFYRRFFNQQFKRSCSPDGAKIGVIGLSPRGDWNMPSDACAELWLKELEDLERKFTTTK